MSDLFIKGGQMEWVRPFISAIIIIIININIVIVIIIIIYLF